MPIALGIAIGHKLATLRDLDEHYSAEDLYDMIEVEIVDGQNRLAAQKKER